MALADKNAIMFCLSAHTIVDTSNLKIYRSELQ